MTSGVLRNRLRSAFRVAELGAGAALASARSRLVNVRGEVPPPPRQPYVQSVSASSAVIAWVSEEPDAGLVEYGETPQLGRKAVDAQTGRRHAVSLTGLSPASTYHYLVSEGDGVSEMARFRTAPEGEDSRFSF